MAHATIEEMCRIKHSNNNSYNTKSTVCSSIADSVFSIKEEKMTLIIGIDNGNYNTKTLNCTFASGVVEYESDPLITKDKLK